jgi:hypothetical protein
MRAMLKSPVEAAGPVDGREHPSSNPTSSAAAHKTLEIPLRDSHSSHRANGPALTQDVRKSGLASRPRGNDCEKPWGHDPEKSHLD